MLLFKKLGLPIGIIVILSAIILTTWSFWPTKIDVKLDESETTDESESTDTVNGKAFNSQNNNSSHINFSGTLSILFVNFYLVGTTDCSNTFRFCQIFSDDYWK